MIIPIYYEWIIVVVLSRSPCWAGAKASLPISSPTIVQSCHCSLHRVDQSFHPSQQETLQPLPARNIWSEWACQQTNYNCGERFSPREIMERPTKWKPDLCPEPASCRLASIQDDFWRRMEKRVEAGGRVWTEVSAANSPLCLSPGFLSTTHLSSDTIFLQGRVRKLEDVEWKKQNCNSSHVFHWLCNWSMAMEPNWQPGYQALLQGF